MKEMPGTAVKDEVQWDLEITPRKHLLEINFLEIWHYKDLIWLLVRRDFVAQYKQTILGPLWHIIQPILTTLMFLLVFGRIAGIPTDGIPPFLFYMSGITLWNYFSFCLINTSNTFIANAAIFGKVYFPRIIMPLAVVISNLMRFGIQALLLLAVMIWYHFNGFPIEIAYKLMIIPFLLVSMAGMGLGLGIIISSLTTKYRDLTVLLSFMVQLYMYATPIAYPMSYLQNASYSWIFRMNPLTPLIESFRYALFGQGSFNIMDLVFSTGFMLVVLIAGLILFNKVEKTFMDTV